MLGALFLLVASCTLVHHLLISVKEKEYALYCESSIQEEIIAKRMNPKYLPKEALPSLEADLLKFIDRGADYDKTHKAADGKERSLFEFAVLNKHAALVLFLAMQDVDERGPRYLRQTRKTWRRFRNT